MGLRSVPLRARHSQLKRAAEGPFPVGCPVDGCEGLLSGHRICGRRVWTDHCPMCGQRIVYEDRTIGGERVYRPIRVSLLWRGEPTDGGELRGAAYPSETSIYGRFYNMTIWLDRPYKQGQSFECLVEPSDIAPFTKDAEFDLSLGEGRTIPGKVLEGGAWGYQLGEMRCAYEHMVPLTKLQHELSKTLERLSPPGHPSWWRPSYSDNAVLCACAISGMAAAEALQELAGAYADLLARSTEAQERLAAPTVVYPERRP